MLLAAILLSSASVAAEGKQPLETFSVYTGGLTDVGQTNFHDTWQPEAGFDLSVTMPFYYGEVEVGITFLPYSALSNKQPDFTSEYTYFGWGDVIPLSRVFDLSAGIRVGTFRFVFEGENIEKHRRFESEFCAAIVAGVESKLYSAWSFELSASYVRIYTAKRIDMFYLSGGVSRTFSTPDWMREFLK